LLPSESAESHRLPNDLRDNPRPGGVIRDRFDVEVEFLDLPNAV
jgi:hypothetical protein